MKKMIREMKYFVKTASSDDKALCVFGVSWVASLVTMVALKGLLLGFVMTVTTLTVSLILAYNIYSFFKND